MAGPISRRLASRLLLVGAAFALAACSTVTNNGSLIQVGSAPYTEGSGKPVTDTRQLAAFHALSLQGPLSVTIAPGSGSSAAITADDNLLALIRTEVRDGTLTISIDGSLSTHNPIKATIATAALDSVIQRHGSTVDYENIAAESMAVDIGAGSTLRAGGHATSLTVAVADGSTADLRNVTAETASVRIDSGSTAHLSATRSVTGDCRSGSTLLLEGGAESRVTTDTSSTVKVQ
jgi:hypothetical protein